MTATASVRTDGSIWAFIRASPCAAATSSSGTPNRKFFLLGKRITGDWLADLTVSTE